MKFYAGIDLGKDGGIVVLDEHGTPALRRKTPLIRSAKNRDDYDLTRMVTLVEAAREQYNDIHFFLEKAQPMPARMGGGVANFQRGYSYGLWLGILSHAELPLTVVSPRRWQAEMLRDVAHEDTKQAAYIVASRLWPSIDWRLEDGLNTRRRNPDTGLVDAALIAEYGRRTLK